MATLYTGISINGITFYFDLIFTLFTLFLQRKSIDHRPSVSPQYDTFCHGRATALYIDKFSRFFFPFSFVILNILYWTTFL